MKEAQLVAVQLSPAEGLTTPERKIGVNAFLGTFGTALLIQGCTVLQGVLIARLLGPIGRGEYSAIILWPSLFAGIGIFGANIAISRAAAKTSDHATIFRSAVITALFTSGITSGLCYLCIPLIMPNSDMHLTNISRLFILFIPLNHLALHLNALDQGAGNFKVYNLTRAVLYPVYLAFLVFFWLSETATVTNCVISLLVANLAVVICRAMLALRRYPICGNIYPMGEIAKESVRFGLAGVAIPFYQHIDKALLLWLLGAENLGIYVVALSASGVIGSFTNATGLVTFTVAAQARQGEGFSQVTKAFRVSLLSWLALGGVLAAVMSWVLPIVYGHDFHAAVEPARLLILGSAFAGLSVLLEQAMRGQGRAFVGLGGRLSGLVVMASLGLLLSRRFGLNGICAAFILGQLTCLLVIIYRTNQHYGLSSRAVLPYIPQAADAYLVLNRLNSLGRKAFHLFKTIVLDSQ